MGWISKQVQTAQAFCSIMQQAKRYRAKLALAILGVIIAKGCEGILYRFLLPTTVDAGLIAKESSFLLDMPWIVLVVFASLGTGEFLAKFMMGRVGRGVVRDHRVALLNHLLQVEAATFQVQAFGNLISKINYDTEQVATAVSDAIRELLSSIISVVILTAVLLSLSWQITLSMLFVLPIVVAYLKISGRLIRRYSERVQNTMGTLTQVSSEIIQGWQAVRLSQGEPYERQRIIHACDNNLRQEMKIFLINSLSSPILQSVCGAVLVLVISMVAYEWLPLSPGTLVGIVGALLGMVRPLKQFFEVHHVLQKGIAATKSIQALLDVPAAPDNGTCIKVPQQGEIQLHQVSFSYPKQPLPALKTVSLHITAGSTVAVVGRSGCGKSTLVALLTRLFEPTSGSISIDGVGLPEYSLHALRQSMAVVNQQGFLFHDTIAANISYGTTAPVNQARLYWAAQAANALNFIQALPQGFATCVGENGAQLSGGQRQRIILARALYKKAPILILDEATSALDPESETAITQALSLRQGQRTTIVITHRLSTIERADRILVFDQGKLVEQGQHAELLNLQGTYARLRQLPLESEAVLCS